MAALVLAAMLLAVPWALSQVGMWGPGIDEQIGGAERALAAARAYGGAPDDPPFHAAEEHLEAARRFARGGEAWRARRSAAQAATHAVLAQREALAARESARRQLMTVGTDVDRRLNELEDLYASLARRSGKASAEPLLPLMKDARKAGAGVLLAIEEGEYRRALALSPDALATLENAKKTLQSAR